MTPETAMYHRAMLLVGIHDRFDRDFDEALEQEEPLSDLILALCTCVSDRAQVISVLHNYTLAHPADETQVCRMIREDVLSRYQSGELTRVEVVSTLYDIVMQMDKFWQDPWQSLTELSWETELWDDGILSNDVFNQCFDAWFLRGERLDALKLQDEIGKRTTNGGVNMKKRKFWSILLILLPLIAAVLNALPNAVKLNFATPERTLPTYFSGYSMVPVGYACWGAMIAGVGGIVLTVMGIIAAVTNNGKLRGRMQGIAMAAALMGLTMLPMGNMTLVGAIVTALLAAEALLISYLKNRKKPKDSDH